MAQWYDAEPPIWRNSATVSREQAKTIDSIIGNQTAPAPAPAIDRAELDIAIRSLEAHSNLTDATQWKDLEKLVYAAARKHLDTLPKKQWCVTGYVCNGAPAASFVTDDHGKALDFARDYLRGGITNVSVREWYGQ